MTYELAIDDVILQSYLEGLRSGCERIERNSGAREHLEAAILEERTHYGFLLSEPVNTLVEEELRMLQHFQEYARLYGTS